ncbi:MAG: hypothetical protein NC084_07505 [Bacteroides sp.]|nr:hypothetical protein [Eubacterium sp.]MCM1417510.1 hypothetical protein [Roseburia sp.]MCM1462545.1 hypothetical protein [Bacteroides sp.]
MKSSSWCLYLGEARAYDVPTLRRYFDTALVSGYLLGGTLERWLSDAGEAAILARVRAIDYGGDIGEQLEHIFGVRPARKTRLPACLIKKPPSAAARPLPSSYFREGFAPRGSYSFGSYHLPSGSYRLGSFRTGSFQVGSYYIGSYRLGSYRYEWEWEFERGSYRKGSFYRTSFGAGGSFRAGSYRKGSFSGSYRFYAGNAEITEEEYRRTLINLSSCPLNEYGYGIHLI